MMKEEIRTERIENYLQNKMSETDLRIFEAEMQEDTELRKDVERHRKAHKVLEYANRKELKSKLKAIDDEESPAITNKRRQLYTRIAIAAAFLATIALTVTQLTFVDKQHDKKVATTNEIKLIAADYFSPTSPENQRGAQSIEGYQSKLSEADSQYLEGNYQVAIEQYEELHEMNHALNDRAEWNLLIAKLSAGQSAGVLLDKILDDPTHMYHEKAEKLARDIGTR